MAVIQTNSATSARVDMVIDNNGTWADAFQFGAVTDALGNVVNWNLTGSSFHMSVQVTRYDAVALLVLTTANGRILTTDPIQRVVQLNVLASDIQANLKPGQYVYDFVMFDSANPSIRTPLMHGLVTVKQGVTLT